MARGRSPTVIWRPAGAIRQPLGRSVSPPAWRPGRSAAGGFAGCAAGGRPAAGRERPGARRTTARTAAGRLSMGRSYARADKLGSGETRFEEGSAMADIQRIESLSGLDELIEGNKDRQVWIFKHSLTCPISGAAWAEFKRFAADHSQGNGTVFAVIEIQYARPVS